MSSYTVNQQSQAIFLAGQSDPYMVQNTGPAIIYLDDDSAVNTSSFPLPPTATTVWHAGRPLWALGAIDGCSLVASPNSTPVSADRLHVSVPLLSTAVTNLTVYETDYIDARTYDTLTIRASVGNIIRVRHWRVQDGVRAGGIFVSGSFAVSEYLTTTAATLQVPVISDFVTIQTSTTFPMQIWGRTRRIPESVDRYGGLATGADIGGLIAGTQYRNAAFIQYVKNDVIPLNSLTPFLTVLASFSAATTAAGRFQVVDADSVNVMYELTIPVFGATTRYALTHVPVPVSSPYYVQGIGYTTAGNVDLTIIGSET